MTAMQIVGDACGLIAFAMVFWVAYLVVERTPR